MKRLLLLLLLSQAWALTVTKTVSGPELIDVNDTVDVAIGIDASSPFFLERIEDDVPRHFAVVSMPSACTQVEGGLVCEFGQEFQGQVVVSYQLLSTETGYGIFGSPRVYYDGGVKTIDMLRPYFVGRPLVKLTLESETALLPGDDIVASVVLENPGAKPLGNVTLRLDHSNGSVTRAFSLSAGESLREEFLLGQAAKTGFTEIHATASWSNGSVSAEKTVIFISPDVSLERSVTPRWKVEDGALKGYVEVVYTARNDGTAAGNLSFVSGRGLRLEPGETKSIKEEYESTAPAEEASVTDDRGTVYGTFSFAEETPELTKDFLTLIYENVGSSMPSWMALLVLAGAVYFSTKFENPYVKAGFFVIAFVSLLLLYSQHYVGALSVPGFGPRT